MGKMRNIISVCLFIFFGIISGHSQTKQEQLSGMIINYYQEPLALFKYYADSLIFIDSTSTDKDGFFTFKPLEAGPNNKEVYKKAGLYRVRTKQNNSFYILYEPDGEGWGNPVQTVFEGNPQVNMLGDSLRFLYPITGKNKKKGVNEIFLEFQQLQKDVNVAYYLFTQMLRFLPDSDPFHRQMEEEYLRRFKAIDSFTKKQLEENPSAMSTKIIKAYYFPFIPDWRMHDEMRDSITAAHFFDYFNPADSFYLHTNILTEKIDLYISLRVNKRDEYGQPFFSEEDLAKAADDYLKQIIKAQPPHQKIFNFSLTYILNVFERERKYDAFLFIYDKYLGMDGEICEIEDDEFENFRKIAGLIKGLQIGSLAPDFDLQMGGSTMHRMRSDYTLLIFWASWCSHCHQELISLKEFIETYTKELEKQNKSLVTIAVSLDNDKKLWEEFINKNKLTAWLHTAELKGWMGKVPRLYNIYATPSMFILDKNKKILSTPISAEEVEAFFKLQK